MQTPNQWPIAVSDEPIHTTQEPANSHQKVTLPLSLTMQESTAKSGRIQNVILTSEKPQLDSKLESLADRSAMSSDTTSFGLVGLPARLVTGLGPSGVFSEAQRLKSNEDKNMAIYMLKLHLPTLNVSENYCQLPMQGITIGMDMNLRKTKLQ